MSKDLLEIGAVRVRNTSGTLVYAPPATEVASDSTAREARLSRVCAELLVSVASSSNLAVLKTPPGAAQYFASAIDRVSNPEILGTIAGDDTIMIKTQVETPGVDGLVRTTYEITIVQAVIGTKVEFRLNDSLDSCVAKRVNEKLANETTGRCITSDELISQVALPIINKPASFIISKS